MEAHKSNIDKAVNEAIQQAGLSSVNDIDVIAVTKGPGLEVCLRVGLRKAQLLAREFQKTFVTVHHLEAHCMTARLGGILITSDDTSSNSSSEKNASKPLSSSPSSSSSVPSIPKLEFPFLTLLASGGHTSIVLCHGLGNYTVLGGTLDDALGEAFDKVSRILGIVSERSGGAAVEEQAAAYFERNKNVSMNVLKDRLNALNMKLPLLGRPNCDFSYSGTSYTILYYIYC
jgi:N6-L-threonylcarbamoyladenine synthase